MAKKKKGDGSDGREAKSGVPETGNRVVEYIISVIAKIPESHEQPPPDPDAKARELVSQAALKAAGISGTLALPPGPMGIITILPDLLAIWRIQAQMVSDIAAVYGQTASLTREAMMYCLFKHAAAQAVRDLVARVGERILVRRASLRAVQRAARAISIKITQRVVQRSVIRWLPIAGAAGVAAYAYYDTWQVGQTAIRLFGGRVPVTPQPGASAAVPVKG